MNIKKFIDGKLVPISTKEEITKNDLYSFDDYPEGGITASQMENALTKAQEGFYQINSVFMCVQGNDTYTIRHFYKFTGTGWEDVTPAHLSPSDIVANNGQETTATLETLNVKGTNYKLGGGAEEDNVTITKNSEEKIQAVGTIEHNKGGVVKDWYGTQEEYDAISEKDTSVSYHIEGQVVEANPTEEATETLSKLGVNGTVYNIPSGGSEQKYEHNIYIEGLYPNTSSIIIVIINDNDTAYNGTSLKEYIDENYPSENNSLNAFISVNADPHNHIINYPRTGIYKSSNASIFGQFKQNNYKTYINDSGELITTVTSNIYPISKTSTISDTVIPL